MNTYTHDELKIIIRFILEEERRQAREEYLEALANAPTPEDPKPKKTAPKKIDHGKIIALYKAGWSVAKIADEMRCSDQTVRNHITQAQAGGEI